MQNLALALVESEVFVLGFIGVMMATMIIPVFVIASWYHRNINKTQGGRRLMRAHNSSGSARAHIQSSYRDLDQDKLSAAEREFKVAGQLHNGIMDGDYGTDARAIQLRMYKYFGLWVLAVLMLVGVMVGLLWMAGRI